MDANAEAGFSAGPSPIRSIKPATDTEIAKIYVEVVSERFCCYQQNLEKGVMFIKRLLISRVGSDLSPTEQVHPVVSIE